MRLRPPSFPAPLLLLLCGALLSACIAEDPESEFVGKSEFALAVDGRWRIPADVLAIGDTQNDVQYTGAGAWLGEQSCSATGMRPGAQELREYISEYFPQVSGIGGYSCRHIVGNANVTSVHATGRALDIHIPLSAEASADNDLGDPLAHWLIENSERIGIQLIIWDRSSWGPHRDIGNKERAYTGAHPHHDHLHVELSAEAGERGTSWFSEEREPPVLGECLPLPAEGGIIDDMDGCTQVMGPSKYWRYVQGPGYGDSLFWTNAFESDTHSNWARWGLNLEAGGSYELEVYIEPEYSIYRDTRYELVHDGSKSSIVLDQSSADGWHSLGVFEFAAGADQHLSLFDNGEGEVPEEQRISADAIRLSPSSAEPDPEPEPDPDFEPEEDVVGGCSSTGGSPSGFLSGLVLLLLLWRRRTPIAGA